MKTAIDRVSSEKAFTEMKRFTIAGLVLSVISIFILWPLAIGGIAFSGRGLLLTWHKANKVREKIMGLRVAATAGLIIGVVSLGLFQATH